MIIPPDPEKDPRLFSESRTSVATADLVSLDEPAVPEVAYHPDFLYTSPFTDDYATYPNEALPPYEGQQTDPLAARPSPNPRVRRSVRNSDLLVRVTSAASSSSSLGSSSSTSSRATARATHHGSAVPINLVDSNDSSATAVGSSRPKVWEKPLGSRRRFKAAMSPELRAFWRRNKRWIVFLIIVAIAAILVAIGLAVGLGVALQQTRPTWSEKQKPTRNTTWPGSNASVQIGTLNITYVPRRDDPKKEDGMPSDCNQWTPINMTSPLSQLALTSGYFNHYLATFQFPLSNETDSNQSTLANPLYFIAHGLAASGTVEILGADAPASIKDDGAEGMVQVDVLARSPRDRQLEDVAKVCKLTRKDGSTGVGIFTPIETDQSGPGTTMPYLLDPLQTPAFHVIIRLPPSAMNYEPDSSVLIPSVTFDLAGMGMRIGNLKDIARFGSLKFETDCRGAGFAVNYVAADNILISGAEGTVQGTFNVSSSLNINSTSGPIFANVILHDPENINDTSTTIQSSIPMPKMRRGYKPPPSPHEEDHDEYEDSKLWEKEEWKGSASAAETSAAHSETSAAYSETSAAHSETSAAPNATWAATPTSGADTPKHSNATVNATAQVELLPYRNRTINTTFVTGEGFIFVAYLHHPSTTALQAFVASQSGMVDVALHPNYIGPFALVNLWGSIRLPPISWSASPDPLWLDRSRKVLQGSIDVGPGTYFGDAQHRYSETSESAASSVTGAALWSSADYPLHSAKQAQYSPEGKCSALYALTNLGDLQVTFDGT